MATHCAWTVAVSIASASSATKSARISCSMSGVDYRFIRWLNLLNAPTVLGVIVTLPMVWGEA